MAKPTPGPWQVVRDEYCERPWNWDVCATRDAGPVLVARVRAVAPEGDDETNARLIAAAPELLEALQRYIEANRTARDDGDFRNKIALAQQYAEAAIQKATGGGGA